VSVRKGLGVEEVDRGALEATVDVLALLLKSPDLISIIRGSIKCSC
jgi:hypothetical protein